MDKGHFKFHYFPLNARGAITRAILSAAKADWENLPVQFDQWPTVKTSGLCEFGQLPILEHGDKKLSQSMAIELYVSRLFGLMGKTADDEYQITSLLCTYEDLFMVAHNIIWPRNEKEKNNKEKITEQFIEKYTFFIKKIQERYIAHGKGKYFLGESFSLADIYLAVMISSFCCVMKEKCPTKKEAPEIYALITRVKENELKEYFEKYFYKDAKI